MAKKPFLSKISDYKSIIGFMIFIVGLVFIWDRTYVRAEVEIKNNADLQRSIELQQQTIANINTKLSIEIAKLKRDNRKEAYNNFILEHGENMSEMDDLNKIKFLNLKTKLENAEKEYDILLE